METMSQDAIDAGHSYSRGNAIIFLNGKWVYQDDLAPLPATGGKTRPCAACGIKFPLGQGEVDPCLGILPGVDNACCGHGIPGMAYIRFKNGVVIKEFKIEYEKGEIT